MTRDVIEYVLMTRFGKTRKEKMVVGTVHATCRLGRVSIKELKEAIRAEFHHTGRYVPAWRVQALADEIHARIFAEVLLDEPTDIPF